MGLLTLYAGIEQIFGNFFALSAAVGSFILLLTAFSDADSSELDQIKEWGIGGFIAGAVGQFSMLITGIKVEKIGVIFPLTQEYVNSLLYLSLVLLVLRIWLRSNRYRFS